jgi:hypothetical protein
MLSVSCDPGVQVHLQVHNATQEVVDVHIFSRTPQLYTDDMLTQKATVTLSPGQSGEVQFQLATGDHGGPVQAFAGGQQVFCQEYTFPADGNFRANYQIDIRTDHLAC